MKVFSFLIILIVSIILSSKSESEACVWNNWFCDWITGRNNNGETTAPSITEDEKMQAISDISFSINQFSIELHKAMAKKTNGSFISSPLSAAMVLMMAAYGARGENADKMNSLLHFDTNNNTYKTGINSLIEMFDALNPIGFKLANKIYAGKNKKIESDFISLISETFKSSIENVDFELTEDTTTKINDWRAEISHQLIRNVIEADEISADTELFLINSLYFSALWKYPFIQMVGSDMYVEAIVNRYKFPGSSVVADIIEFKRDSKNDGLMRFIMLYGMSDADFYNIERYLTTLEFFDLHQSLVNRDLYVPELKIESIINLKDMLNLLGINFSGISKQGSKLKMNKIVQKLTLESNMLGMKAAIHSEASFANKTENSGPSSKQDPFSHFLPLTFLITCNKTILFTGKANHVL